ncbi:hypothetical protein [Lactiplantibacillus plantarum]|uniref:hypothetical protein n=1 Tax=Lactiplantibacillus plantarum TaxID=1590 RepID=UPI001BABE5BF|nr:hypothetical protein [Lactiplantibacillus plantarum]MBS0938046.1 hypothetical protein [Lactiplantibacillus plantarum]MBS0945715.1 hypothetical protein [Lactiplantibacillus plantarum]
MTRAKAEIKTDFEKFDEPPQFFDASAHVRGFGYNSPEYKNAEDNSNLCSDEIDFSMLLEGPVHLVVSRIIVEFMCLKRLKY